MHFLQSRIASRKLFNVFSSRQGQHKFLAVYKSQSGDDEKQNKTYLYQIPPWMKKSTEVEKEREVQKDVQEKFNERINEEKSDLEKAESQQTFNEINIQEMTRCKSVYKIKRRLSPIPKKSEPPKLEKAKEFENLKNEAKHDFFSRSPPVESPFKVLQSKSLKFPPRVDPFPAATELFHFKEPIAMKKFENPPEKRILKSIKVDEIVKKIDAHKIAFNFAEKERNLKETKKIDFKKIPINVQEIEKNVKEMLKKKTVINALDKYKNSFNKIPENNEIRKPNKIEVEKNLKELLLMKKAAQKEKENQIKSPETPKNEEKAISSKKEISSKKDNSSKKEISSKTEMSSKKEIKAKHFDFLFPKSVEDKKKVWKEILENFESETKKPLKTQLVVDLPKKPLKFSSKEMLFPKEEKKTKIEKVKKTEKIKSDIDTKNMEVLTPKVDKTKNVKDKKLENFNESIINLRKEGERLRMEFEKNKKNKKKPKRLNAVINKDSEKTKQPKILNTKKSLRKKRKFLRKTNMKRSQRVKAEKLPAPKKSLVLKKNSQVKDKILTNWTSQIPDRLLLPKYSNRSVFDNNFTKPEEKEIKTEEKQEVIKIKDEKIKEVKINDLKDVNDATESIYCVALKPDKEELNEPILNMADRKLEFDRLPKQIKDALIRLHSDNKNLEIDIMRKTFNYETENKDKIEKSLINVEKQKKIEPTGFSLIQKKLQNMVLKYKCCFQTAMRTWDMNKKINNEKQKSSILIFGGGKVLNKIKNQKRQKKEKGKCTKKVYNINMKHKSTLFQNLQSGRDKKILLAEGPKPKKNIILRNSKHKKVKKANNLTKVKRKVEMKKIEVKPAPEPVKIDALAPGMSYSEILTAVFSNKSISAHFKK